MNLKFLVGQKENHRVFCLGGAMAHLRAFGKPYRAALPKRAIMCDERAFQHIHAVGAGVGMPGI